MPKHVLVVDDNKFGADTWAQALATISGGEFLCEAVYSGQDCLARLHQDPPIDVVLLDIDMPTVSGANVIRAILKTTPSPHFRVVPVTAWGPGWEDRWGLNDIKDSVEFKRLVHPTVDKSDASVAMLLDSLREAVQHA